MGLAQFTFPQGISSFACAAGGCDEICCSVWRVEQGRRESSPCEYLDASGLCRVQLAGRGETLCEICQVYPRAVLQTGPGQYDVSLHLSCLRAVNCLIMTGQPVGFAKAAGPDELPATLAGLAALLEDENRRDNFEITPFAETEQRDRVIVVLQDAGGGTLWQRLGRLGALPGEALLAELAKRLRAAANNHWMTRFVAELGCEGQPQKLAARLATLNQAPSGPFEALVENRPTVMENYLVCAAFGQLPALVCEPGDYGREACRLLAGQYLLFRLMMNHFALSSTSREVSVGEIARSIYKQYRFDN